MNMKKNGFCMESISKGKSYDNLLPSKIPQNSSNEIFIANQTYGSVSIVENGILQVKSFIHINICIYRIISYVIFVMKLKLEGIDVAIYV